MIYTGLFLLVSPNKIIFEKRNISHEPHTQTTWEWVTFQVKRPREREWEDKWGKMRNRERNLRELEREKGNE